MRYTKLAIISLCAMALGLTCETQQVLQATTEVSGLSNPWDVGWLPNGTMLVTERPGRLNVYVGGSSIPPVVFEPTDVVVYGEGGMLGLEVDPTFDTNGYVFVCMTSNAGGSVDVRLVRFTLSQNGDAILQRADIVTGMPYNDGRHSGCRPRFGPDGYLWVGTGDAATGTTPQDDDSLGGKVLRVTRNGDAAPGNPNGRLWFSKGHRNVQGIAFRSDGFGVSVEHGSDADDEVNSLASGNFGWDPAPGYNETVPMTDLGKFPNAVEAIWSSGSPTIAPSGAEFLEGRHWGVFSGTLAVATLKASHLRLFYITEGGLYFAYNEQITNRGRLRSPRLGPDGNLYVTTDGSGGGGAVLKVVPATLPAN
ncbi:MAG: PQQ-dependent sugar dehydrogenase [Polyangiales bacterium]